MPRKEMPAEALGMPPQTGALGTFVLVAIGDLGRGGGTYRPVERESAAWSYSESIIFLAPTARPNCLTPFSTIYSEQPM
jgi:hypothetical protein